MIPYKLNTMSPYLREPLRLSLLHSGATFGNDTDFLKKMDQFVGHVHSENFPQTIDIYNSIRTLPYPDLTFTRPPLVNRPTDILLKDVYRQHYGIEERQRKFLPNSYDILRIGDPITRDIYSSTRGFERELVNRIGMMDAEALARQIR